MRHATLNSMLAAMIAAISSLLISDSLAAASMGAETRLTAIKGTARSPRLSAYGDDLHVVWAEGTAPDTYDIWTIHSANNGDSWLPPVQIASNVTSASPSPQIGAGKNGVYVFWTDNYRHQSSGSGIYYARSTDDGDSFSSPSLVIAKVNNGYTRPSSVLVDASTGADRVFFAWYDSREGGGAEIGQVFLVTSCDAGSTFSAPQQVTANDRGNDAEAPRLAMSDDASVLYLLYRSSMDGIPQEGWPPFSQRLVRSSAVNCGSSPVVSWLTPSQQISAGMPAEPGNTYGGALVAGKSDRLHSAYWFEGNGNNLVYKTGRPTTSGWEDPIDLTSALSGFGLNHLQHEGGPVESNAFGLGEDASNNLHVAFWQKSTTKTDGFTVGKILYRKGSASGASYAFGAAENVVSTDVAFDPRAILTNDRLVVVWADFRDNADAAGGSEIYYRHVYVNNLSGRHISISATTMDLGQQLINSSGSPRSLAISVTGDQSVSFSGVTATGPFSATTDCGTQAAGSSCSVYVTFAPTTVGAATGTLTINSDATNAPHTISLSGTAGDSLVEHYYHSILDRPSDENGKAFWDSEVTRMVDLGAAPKEVFIVMANYFFNSDEYLSRNTTDTAFITHLYLTFFARSPDSAGLNYWLSQLQAGMPRDIVMFNFLFSTEFDDFMGNFFGATSNRSEVQAVVDYYRGILNRLPDTIGLEFWVDRFRAAQCKDAGAVYAEAESISKSFFDSGEYLNRNRTNSQYVSDLYNAFLRRGGDLEGVNYWINELDTTARTRDQMRADFISTPEFTTRIDAIVNEGCLQSP